MLPHINWLAPSRQFSKYGIANIGNAMAAKILQALREEDNEILYSIKDGSNHLERSQEMLSLEIKCEDEEFKMIGLE